MVLHITKEFNFHEDEPQVLDCSTIVHAAELCALRPYNKTLDTPMLVADAFYFTRKEGGSFYVANCENNIIFRNLKAARDEISKKGFFVLSGQSLKEFDDVVADENTLEFTYGNLDVNPQDDFFSRVLHKLVIGSKKFYDIPGRQDLAGRIYGETLHDLIESDGGSLTGIYLPHQKHLMDIVPEGGVIAMPYRLNSTYYNLNFMPITGDFLKSYFPIDRSVITRSNGYSPSKEGILDAYRTLLHHADLARTYMTPGIRHGLLGLLGKQK